MKLNRLKLINDLKRVLPGVESGNSILDGADTISFTENSILSYNDSIAVSVPTSTGIIGSVKSKEFFNLLQKLKDDEITAVVKKNKLIIKCGKVKADLKLVESTITKYLDNLGLDELKWKKVKKGFIDSLKLCRLSGSTSPYRGIYVNDDVMMSTDEIRVAVAHLEGEYTPFWIDDCCVNELLKVDVSMTEISVVEGWVHFKEDNGAIFSCKTNNVNKYPFDALYSIKQEKAVEKKGDAKGTLPKTFKEVVDRVSVLSEDLQGFSVVELKFTTDNIVLSCNRDAGSIKETITWDEPLKLKEEVTTSADAGFLIEASSKSMDFYVTKYEDNTFIVFNKERFTLILAAIA